MLSGHAASRTSPPRSGRWALALAWLCLGALALACAGATPDGNPAGSLTGLPVDVPATDGSPTNDHPPAASALPAEGETAMPSLITQAAASATLAPATPSPTPQVALTESQATVSPATQLQATQSPSCWQEGGRLELGVARDPRLPLPMEYRVYLPPCYDQHPEQRYPVLYLIHGQNYNDDQWDRLGADETASRLAAAGEIAPMLIVMPRDRSWAQPSEDLFGTVLVETLLPLIDASYRTRPERAQRAIGGLSRGAGWAVHLGLAHWELFGAIGAHSLPVFWSDTRHIRAWLQAIPAAELPRLYLDIGEKDRPNILQSARWFEGVLTELNIPHEWHLFPGYHEEAYWEAHLEGYLRWYAAPW